MSEFFSFRELYDVSIKTTCEKKVGDTVLAAGETVAFFDSVQIGNFQELKQLYTASGGFQNRSHIFWESAEGVQISFIKGVFSRSQFAFLNNLKMLNEDENGLSLAQRETIESDVNGNITLKYPPIANLYVYTSAGIKASPVLVSGTTKTYAVGAPYEEYTADYTWEYTNGQSTMTVGQPLLNGFLTLEARTRVKGDETGTVKTGIIKIPKLKLVSALSISLGDKASPAVGNFQGIACPIGERGATKVAELGFLNDDIDSDI